MGELNSKILTQNKIKNEKKYKRWQKVLGVLMSIVVFITTYALILPAITMETKTYCGQEEHQHGESCYVEQIICDTEDTVIPHEHVEECYQEEVLVCTQEDEVIVHEHSDSCYEQVFACDKEEHTHGEICYSDKTADIETAADWENTLPNESELTGVWADDVITVAKSQLGYTESERNYIIDDNGKKLGYTRYGEWYGNSYGHWCAMFVSFSLHYAGVEDFPYHAGCEAWKDVLASEEYGCWRDTDSYIPAKGDLIFFNWDSLEDMDHVGLITELIYEGNVLTEIKTIEGNADNQVCCKTYSINDNSIAGYAKLPENPELEKEVKESELEDSVAEENTEIDKDEKVSKMMELIDKLPSYEEIDETLLAYEESDDWDGYETYYRDVKDQAYFVYTQYYELSEEQKEEVTNVDKLFELQWLWDSTTFASASSLDVYYVNNYDTSVNRVYPILLSHMSVGDLETQENTSFKWWIIVVVEENEDGQLYVKAYDDQISADREGYTAYEAETDNGFVLLFHDTYTSPANLGIVENAVVSVDFTYKNTTGSYTGSPYGTVGFGNTAQLKPAKDNTSKLEIVPSADTAELIEVNLYDYSSTINTLYESDSKYPGFQQDEGTPSIGSSLSSGSFNFGNNITSDLAAGISGLTNAGGAINATKKDSAYGNANEPITGAISDELIGGYPALSDGTSLDYLFSNSRYATKKNDKSINGLFKYDSETGAYSFNSRENHAQFNAGSDTFTLYDSFITSNFMMYPFGNFLPFNDIITQCQQAKEIDREYLLTIANSAQYKQDAGMSKYNDEYGTLAAALTDFVDLMDQDYPNGWDAADAMNEYFAVSGLNKTFSIDDEILEKTYSIDYDEATDFYFGMDMKMTFMQPKDGYTGLDGKQPMIFEFTGDDDVWIYIDGKLFLDLTGIHRHVGGSIDFVNGLVSYYALDKNTGDVSTTAYKTLTFEEILGTTEGLNSEGTFEDFSRHTLNFYYMERGAGSGVCRMNFNFPLVPNNAIAVSKEVSYTGDDGGILGNPDYMFQILKATVEQDNKETRTEEPYVGAGVEYGIYDTHMQKIGTGVTDENGIFKIKAGQFAVFQNVEVLEEYYYVRELINEDFIRQYGDIKVDGIAVTTMGDISLADDEVFVGVDSPVKHITEGTTRFAYNNQIDTDNLGKLMITKKVLSSVEETGSFGFLVKISDNLLPEGTVYTVFGGETSGEERSVETEGIITLKSGETAVIERIIAGSRFEVAETEESKEDYTVVYSVDGVKGSGESATGYVRPAVEGITAAAVVVTNGEKGVSVSIPVKKILSNPDGKEHTYRFLLEEVTDMSGETLVESGERQEISVTYASDETGSERMAEFILNYLERDMPEELPAYYYYKITEVKDAAEPFTVFDNTTYVIKVMVNEAEARVVEMSSDEAIASDDISFTNTLSGKLKISKTVIGNGDSDKEFGFQITLKDKEGDPLTGTYSYTKTGEPEVLNLTLDAEGMAQMSLGHGQKIVISGLPEGTVWAVTETDCAGYEVSVQVDGEEAVLDSGGEGVIEKGGNEYGIHFTNTNWGYELPETGGMGITIFHMLGGILVLGAFVFLKVTRKIRS